MQFSDRGLQRVIFGLLAIGFLALILATAASFYISSENERFTDQVNHTYKVEGELRHLAILIEQVENGKRGFLLADDARFIDVIRKAQQGTVATFARLAVLTRDNPSQQDRIAALRQLAARQSAVADRVVGLIEQGQRAAAIRSFRTDEGPEIIRQMRILTDRMIDQEQHLMAIRASAQAEATELTLVTSLLAGLIVAAVAAGSIWSFLRYTRDLNHSREQLAAVNVNLEGIVAERTANLQRANEEIQRFAYIVSHDLRSPLVNIMGFTSELEAATKPLTQLVDRAEKEAPALVTDDARRTVREDLPEAVGFIRSSTRKMDRLINAILALSREGRRTLASEPVDMSELVQNIRDSMKHRLDEVGAEIKVEGELPPLVSDRLAVEQIVSNLIENAVKYHSPDRAPRVEISGRQVGDHVVYRVADNGRGIDARDHERIFELFRRSGQQDQKGEGIGLAHVRALAYRLGGLIKVESTLGEGSVFSLSLPLQTATS